MDETAIVNNVDQEEVELAHVPWWKIVLKRKLKLKSRTPMPKDEPEGANQAEPERGFWTNEREFILSLLGLAVGLGNVWRFPWMISRHGGGTFLIPYFFMLFTCGLPLFLMELSVGQYSGCGPISVFSIAPLFKGLGWCVLAQSALSATTYITIIVWAFYYFFLSLTDVLPWQECGKEWNTGDCFSIYESWKCGQQVSNYSDKRIYLRGECVDNTTSSWDQVQNWTETTASRSAREFFERKMYKLYNNETHNTDQRTVFEFGPAKWDISLMLVFAWLICCLCVSKGIKSSGKAVYFVATFPYLALLLLLVSSAQLPGSYNGIKYLFSVNATQLVESELWVDASAQIFYSLGLSTGSVMTYASYNRFHNNIIRDALIVGLGNSLTSLFAAFPIFCVVGYVATELGKPINDVINSGSSLVFVIYPEVFPRITPAPFWSALFFFMLITLGLGSQFGSIETLLTACMDAFFPTRLHLKTWVCVVICVILCLVGLPSVCWAGVYWQEIVNYYAAWAVIILATFNCIVYSWVYGAGKIIDHIQHMTDIKFPKTVVYILMFLWKFFAPVVIIVIMILNCVHYEPLKYYDYQFEPGAQAIGWMIAIVPLILIPTGALVGYIRDVRSNKFSAETWYQRLFRLLKPTSEWVPSYKKTEHKSTTDHISPTRMPEGSRPGAQSYGGTENVINTTDIHASET